MKYGPKRRKVSNKSFKSFTEGRRWEWGGLRV
jgi:hypothetical protein